MATSNIAQLLTQVASTGLQATTASGRNAALSAARSLVAALESPAERIARMSWYDPLLIAAVRLGIDAKLFIELREHAGKPATISELADANKADPVLLARLLKLLATADIVKETSSNSFASTPVSNLLATPEGSGSIVNCFSGISTANSKIVDYFRARGYRNPIDKDDSIWRYASGSELHYFDWVFKPGNEEEVEAFLNHMKFKTLATKWYEAVPIDQVFGGTCEEDEVLMVDVGGNTGYDILGFHRTHPNVKGRLIVQDLPKSIAAIDKEEIKPVEAMEHDFFTPQPVRGAKAYYLKMVLHDWPDSACRDILNNLKSALTPGYSKILINEIVVPDIGANWLETGIDMLMMVTHSSAERTETMWTQLIESVGLKITKVRVCGDAVEKLMEVELA
ncbi:hypothetical protein LTR27_002736 [Elasticomyces elasticus]|nr:hypothetical protein LTR27_002736 [Elasticomyces elasticus]